MIYAIFKYERSSGRRSVLTLSIDKDSGGLTIRCPFCERRYRLNPRKRHLRARDGRVLTIPGHQVVLDRKLRPTISRPVLCPNVYCGWSVRITKGQAVDTSPDDTPRREDVPQTPLHEPEQDRTLELWVEAVKLGAKAKVFMLSEPPGQETFPEAI